MRRSTQKNLPACSRCHALSRTPTVPPLAFSETPKKHDGVRQVAILTRLGAWNIVASVRSQQCADTHEYGAHLNMRNEVNPQGLNVTMPKEFSETYLYWGWLTLGIPGERISPCAVLGRFWRRSVRYFTVHSNSLVLTSKPRNMVPPARRHVRIFTIW